MPRLQLTEIKEVSYPLLHYLNPTDGKKQIQKKRQFHYQIQTLITFRIKLRHKMCL